MALQTPVEQLLRQTVSDPNRVSAGEPLARHTTFRIGGPAGYLVAVTGRSELAAVLAVVREHGLELRILGNGSNLLVADQGVNGVVLVLTGELSRFHIDEHRVFAGAGMSLPKLATQVSRQGLAGLTFACAIPGTVGAGLVINAGAHGGDMSRVVESAEVFWLDGRRTVLGPEDIGFGYRTSRLLRLPLVVAEVTFCLHKAPAAELDEQIRRYVEHRRTTQPSQFPNAGSIFKNPPGGYAGQLLEAAGCKGWREGDARVSERHANFIVNTGNATAADVVQLMLRMRERVWEVSGVRLEPEVRIWGANPFVMEEAGKE